MEVLEQKYAEGMLASVLEVFDTMIFMTAKSTSEIPNYPNMVRAEVIGILGFTGTRTGVFALNCSMELAKTICAAMLGMSVDEIESDEEVADSFGEIANMAGGNFKNLWVEDGNTMDLAIPSVVFGQGVNLCTSTRGTGYGVNLEFEGGLLQVHLRFND